MSEIDALSARGAEQLESLAAELRQGNLVAEHMRTQSRSRELSAEERREAGVHNERRWVNTGQFQITVEARRPSDDTQPSIG
jgi:hypothetical protein